MNTKQIVMSEKIDEIKTKLKEIEDELKESLKNVDVSGWSFKIAQVENDIVIDASMQIKIKKK